MKRRIPIVVIVLAAIAATVWWSTREEEAAAGLVASGTVEATESPLGFERGGRLARVEPREGDTVAAGAPLAALDDAASRARREGAAARLAAAEARLAELRAGFRPEEVAQARAETAAADERLADAERDVERTRVLLEGGAVSQEALDKARSAREVAAQRQEQTAEQLRLLRAGPRREQIAAAEAAVAETRAALEAAETDLRDAVLAAPFAGFVSVRHREPGEVVTPGAPVVTLLDRDDRWVRLYVPEDRLGAVHLGAPATIVSDTFPGKSYRGEIVFVGSEAEFTPKNVQTQEERVRLVYQVKVRVLDDPAYELKPGMPVDVTLPLAGPAETPSR